MIRMHIRDTPVGLPASDDGDLLIDQVLQLTLQRRAYPWSSLYNLIGKETAFARKLLTDLQLPPHISQ